MSNTDINTKPAPAPEALPPYPQDLPVAAVADEYPMSDVHERASMAASIAKQGILVPITIWRDEGKWWLLDGRNRVAAAKSVAYRFRPGDFVVFVGDLAAAAAHVEALNSHRRHMTKEQKEERALKLIAKYPGMGSRKLALIVGVSHSTIARLRKSQDEEDTTYKALERAWINASGDAQEEFARAFRVDLIEMLRL
jgi:ParB-like chromosome segregation protein Spo0J